jgi:hypothetical protein
MVEVDSCYFGKEQGIFTCESCWANLACIKHKRKSG